SLTLGPDGALWFVERSTGRLGRITAAGALSFQSVAGAAPTALAAGPQDSLWYAQGSTVHRLGDATEYATGTPVTAPAPRPPGALWAAVQGGAVRIVPGAAPTTIGVDPAAQGLALAAGPDGRMWMTLDRAPFLVKLSVPPRVDTSTVAVDGGALRTTVNPNGL